MNTNYISQPWEEAQASIFVLSVTSPDKIFAESNTKKEISITDQLGPGLTTTTSSAADRQGAGGSPKTKEGERGRRVWRLRERINVRSVKVGILALNVELRLLKGDS